MNTESEKLYGIWRDKPDVSAVSTGYEHDYSRATAREYTEYVYNKYRWKGHDHKRQHAPEIVELVWARLKEIYPKCKFSVRRENCHPIHIRLMKAGLEASARESGEVQDDVNHYHTHLDGFLMDRAKEVMMNIRGFTMSYNFDDNDPMTDYFHTNFYLTPGIGGYRQPYKMEPPRLGSKDKPEVSKHPKGPAHKATRRALGKARFGFIESRKYAKEIILREDCFGSRGGLYFWLREYPSAKMAQKHIGKLEEAGVRCELTGYNEGHVRLLGYTPEMRGSPERGRQEYVATYRAWYSKQDLKTI